MNKNKVITLISCVKGQYGAYLKKIDAFFKVNVTECFANIKLENSEDNLRMDIKKQSF